MQILGKHLAVQLLIDLYNSDQYHNPQFYVFGESDKPLLKVVAYEGKNYEVDKYANARKYVEIEPEKLYTLDNTSKDAILEWFDNEQLTE